MLDAGATTRLRKPFGAWKTGGTVPKAVAAKWQWSAGEGLRWPPGVHLLFAQVMRVTSPLELSPASSPCSALCCMPPDVRQPQELSAHAWPAVQWAHAPSITQGSPCGASWELAGLGEGGGI